MKFALSRSAEAQRFASVDLQANSRACPLCGSRNSKPLFSTIHKCGDCGMGFVSPLGFYHGENETEDYFLNEYLPLHQGNWENSLAERRAHLDMIRGYSTLSAHPRLLDVGCALGLMLKEAKGLGWDPVGVETSEFAARYAADYSECTVHTGTLQQVNFAPDSFDVITLMDVIEHVPDPCGLFREIWRVLRPGGTLFLVTPNFGSFFVWLYREQAYGIGPEEHVSYFQASSLRTALQCSGFRSITVGTKDFYAANLGRLRGRNIQQTPATIKGAFGSRRSLKSLRRAVNFALRFIPFGDKLIGIAQK